MLLIFGLSLLTGALLVDLEKTILYSTLGLVIGIVIAVGIFLAPYDLFGESSDVISAATIVVFSHVAKHLLIGISPFIIGLIFGCLIGDRFE